jgi:hypothetical protein
MAVHLADDTADAIDRSRQVSQDVDIVDRVFEQEEPVGPADEAGAEESDLDRHVVARIDIASLVMVRHRLRRIDRDCGRRTSISSRSFMPDDRRMGGEPAGSPDRLEPDEPEPAQKPARRTTSSVRHRGNRARC